MAKLPTKATRKVRKTKTTKATRKVRKTKKLVVTRKPKSTRVKKYSPPVVTMQGGIPVMTYVMFVFNHLGSFKTPVANAEDGKALMDDLQRHIQAGVPFCDVEKGILVNHTTFSHAFLLQEQVQLPQMSVGQPDQSGDADVNNGEAEGGEVEQSDEFVGEGDAAKLEDMAG